MIHVIDWYAVSSKILEGMGDRALEPIELAARSGLKTATVYKLLRGSPVKLETLLTVLDALNMTPDFVLGYWDGKD